MSAKITFYGGAGTVTGANFLLDTSAQKILIDCGILQRETVCDIAIGFLDAGHVLGAAIAKITRDGRTIVCTGDIGNSPEPLLKDTEFPAGADYLVMESVYGD